MRRLFSAVLLCPLACFSQTANGTLTGIISDPTDAVITEARVFAKHRATGVLSESRSTAAGVYTVSLRPGLYDLTVEASGFKTLVREGIEVNTNQTARVD